MTIHSRRTFMKQAGAAAAVGAVMLKAPRLHASPFGLPLGLQLYSVREQLPKDYEGTLQQIAAVGYKEVEAAGFYGHDATQVNAAIKNAGLHCVSAHYAYDALHPQLDTLIEFGNKIGLGYLICAYPGKKDPSAKRDESGPTRGFTLDDWRWNADQFNKIGEKVHAAGMQFGYHNHTIEWAPQDGIVPYDELLKLTDPKLVTMEMDCGWVVVGGRNPIEYLKKYPSRISMLHVKDFKPVPAGMPVPKERVAAELGHGSIDYKPIFAAANRNDIKHYFVEQEAFDMAPMQALKIDADYMRNLQA
jgi:sugar phosphate isomerase/epimerase